MNLTLRPYRLDDYETLVSWWAGHNWPVVAPQALPNLGYVVEGDKPICAGFLYRTDSMIAWSEFIVADPESKIEERDKGLDMILDGLKKTATEMGFKALFTTLVHKRLIERHKKHGYNITDENVTNMVCSLGGK